MDMYAFPTEKAVLTLKGKGGVTISVVTLIASVVTTNRSNSNRRRRVTPRDIRLMRY